MLTKGVDVLIVAPHNGEIAASIVEAAHAAGRARHLLRPPDPQLRRRPLRLASGRARWARCRREYALKRAPKGNYVLIGGAPTDNNALLLREGQMNMLKPAVDRGDVKIISDQFAQRVAGRGGAAHHRGRADADEATTSQAIVASNDGTAGGAISALDAAGLAGQGARHGSGRAARRRPAHRQGHADDDHLQAHQAARRSAPSIRPSSSRAARRSTPPDKINNGKIDVPSILHEPQAVDKNNLDDTVIKDGYHKREDVYKDVPRRPVAEGDGGWQEQVGRLTAGRRRAPALRPRRRAKAALVIRNLKFQI